MLQFKDRRLVLFGIHIKNLREAKGMTISDVAENTSLIKKDLLAIEEGSKNLGFTTMLELAKGLGEHPSKLLDIDLENG
ncbi:transcriptional regulator with XRE-family HTH domain [Flavobacterium arsenatis]|uniref:Transcriptional regulator with XRE-family HTH domain n=1 Tax=Flavobacterium arsenatis TaxID=1484332 RepID=A0ABU1TSG5_9FLAO|nr:helix-turn-helix domain-containing protein [Flavobacterium arsenatis]MDR6968818.1 transcriptional regulator with XRE-family HTH domain [Flavobacterium arsenatis]